MGELDPVALVGTYGPLGGGLLLGLALLARIAQRLTGASEPAPAPTAPARDHEIDALRREVVDLRVRMDRQEELDRETAAGLARIEGQLVGLTTLQDLLREAVRPGGRR